VVLRDGELQTIDERALLADAQRAGVELVARLRARSES
jgi:hypothetical protein